jgi:nucleotide-binding universal stress UspA family protein
VAVRTTGPDKTWPDETWPDKKEEPVPGIVVGLDGSPNSERALDWALRHAAALNTSITVIAVHEVARSWWGHDPVIGASDVTIMEQVQRSAEDMTQRAVDRLGEAKPADVHVRAVSGFVVKELVDASREADMLVVGSHALHGFAKLVMGSVSTEVVEHSVCPVVIVPHER